MAVIPTGNFGRATPGTVSPGSASGDFGQGQARAIQQLGATIAAVGDYREQQKAEMARAKAVNGVYKYELASMGVVDDVEKKIRSREIAYQDAPSYYQHQIDAIPKPQIDGLDPADFEHFNGITARNVEKHRQVVGGLVAAAEERDYKDQFEQSLDTIGKQAQFPGANIAEINGKYTISAEMGRRARLDPDYINRRIQDAQDTNWFDSVNNKAMQYEATNNVQALQQIKHDLTAENGAYVGVMDTNKRNTLLSGVLTGLNRIEQRQQMQVHAKLQFASSTVKDVADFVYDGGTISRERLASAQQAVSGTPYEAELKQILSFSDRFAEIKKLPAKDQLIFAENLRKQAYSSTDSRAELDMAKKITRAVKENIRTMKEEPLEYLKESFDIRLPPLPLEKLADPSRSAEASEEISAMLAERHAYVSAVAKQNGIALDSGLLNKNEKDQIMSMLNADKESSSRIGALRALRASSPSIDVYKSILRQVELESPVLAQSGMWAAQDKNFTYSTGWFGNKTVTVSPTNVADNILRGLRIVDEKLKTIPADKLFQEKFDEYVGNAYARNDRSYKSAFETVRAYYVGKANEKALSNDSLEPGIIDEALNVVVGGVYDTDSTKVIAPHGMPISEFEEKIESAWNRVRGKIGNPHTPLSVYGLIKLSGEDTKYAVMSGVLPQTDGQGRPIILDVGE